VIDAYDAHMIDHAERKRPVLVRNGRTLQAATLLGWSVPGHMRHYRGRRAHVRLESGARVFVRQADIVLPEAG
jgi:hypothetical protein